MSGQGVESDASDACLVHRLVARLRRSDPEMNFGIVAAYINMSRGRAHADFVTTVVPLCVKVRLQFLDDDELWQKFASRAFLPDDDAAISRTGHQLVSLLVPVHRVDIAVMLRG